MSNVEQLPVKATIGISREQPVLLLGLPRVDLCLQRLRPIAQPVVCLDGSHLRFHIFDGTPQSVFAGPHDAFRRGAVAGIYPAGGDR